MKRSVGSLGALVLIASLAAVVPMTANACVGDAPVTVGSFTAGNPIDPEAKPVWSAAGLELTSIQLQTVCAPTAGVQFIINLEQLNAEPPPEVVRYYWQFSINGHEYWVQAKTSDRSSVPMALDDPAGHIANAPAFRLRGNCGPLVAITNCAHLAWLTGTFDAGADQIRVLVPFGLAGTPGADFASGNVVTPVAPTGTAPGVTVALQAVASNAATSEYMPQEEPYVIG